MKMHEVFAKRNSPWISDPMPPSACKTLHYKPVQLSPVMIAIARMTDDDISKMTTGDLIDLLEFSPVPSQWSEYLREVPHSELAGLRILAVLARRRCREKLNTICQSQGFPVPRYALLSPENRGLAIAVTR